MNQINEDAALRPLARHDDEPAFNHPWQAQTLAMAATLVQAELVSAGEWSERLGAALRRVQVGEYASSPESYYEAALQALEQLVTERGISAAMLEQRVGAWKRAYENTPHGDPVELTAGHQQ